MADSFTRSEPGPSRQHLPIMKYLVTGATGFVGPAVVERLVRDGQKVRVLVRKTSNRAAIEKLGVEIADGDVTDAASVRAAVDGVDAVAHVAGMVKAVRREDLFRVNAGGTRNVARAAAEAGVRRLVYVSSLAAGGPSEPGRPRREEDPERPVSDYGKSKLAGEAAVREAVAAHPRFEAAVVRPPAVYGPRDLEFLGLLLWSVKLGVAPKPGLRDKRYSLIYCDDLADLIVRAAERGRSLGSDSEGVYYGSDGVEYRIEDWARHAGEAMGKRAIVVPVPEFVSFVGAVLGSLKGRITGRPSKLNLGKLAELKQIAWTCSPERAKRELGFEAHTDAATGFKNAVAWFRAQGVL